LSQDLESIYSIDNHTDESLNKEVIRMLQEAIALWGQHQRLGLKRESASVIWENFNQCFYHVQWKPVCLVPPEIADFPIWLWKKGFQTKHYGINRRAIYVSDYSKLFKILDLLRDVSIDEISGLSKESRKRMHYIFPNIPKVAPSLKTKVLTTEISLPEFLVDGSGHQPTKVKVHLHLLDRGCSMKIGSTYLSDFGYRLDFSAHFALAQQFNYADELLKLLRDALEIRKKQTADFDNFQRSLNKRLERYLVFHEV